MRDSRDRRKAGVQRRLATTVEELDAMTFVEYQTWASETDYRTPGESGRIRGTDRERAEDALELWDDRTEHYALEAAVSAAASL
jgi:hypothetical protein